MIRLFLILAIVGCSSPTAPKPVFYSCKADTVVIAGNHYINCVKI